MFETAADDEWFGFYLFTFGKLLKEHGGVAGLAVFLRQEVAKSNRKFVETSGNSSSNVVLTPPDSNPLN